MLFFPVVTKPPYEVNESGWGEFEIQIKIFFMDPAERPVSSLAKFSIFSSKSCSPCFLLFFCQWNTTHKSTSPQLTACACFEVKEALERDLNVVEILPALVLRYFTACTN